MYSSVAHLTIISHVNPQPNDLSRLHCITKQCFADKTFRSRHSHLRPVWLPRALSAIQKNGEGMDMASFRSFEEALRITPAVISKASTVPVVKAGWEGLSPFDWRVGMRKWPGYSDLADDTKLEGCWSAVGAEYLRTLCPSEARLMELVEPAGLPPRIMDRKPLELMPINHGRATLMLPARLNHQRLCVREARDAELEADRQSALEAKVEVAEAKKVAKQDEREAKKLATQVERDRKARENEAIKMTKRDDQKKKKEEKTAARLLSKVSSQGSAQKHKAVTCSNTMGCNAVCVDGDDALLWTACGKGSCRLQVCGSDLCKSVLAAHRRMAHGCV